MEHFEGLKKLWEDQHRFWSWNNDRFERKKRSFLASHPAEARDSDAAMIQLFQSYLRENDQLFREYQKAWLKQLSLCLWSSLLYNVRRIGRVFYHLSRRRQQQQQ
jgi:hypothetical protein